MDMSHEIWPPVVPEMTDLPLSDPKCINESCTAWYAAANASQEAVPFDSLNIYGHWTTWYYLSAVGILTLLHIFRQWHDRRSLTGTASTPHTQVSVFQKAQALIRSFTYTHLSNGPFKWLGLPINGILVFLLSTVLFMTLITFAIRPYYRTHLGYGSPPLAIRSGFTAFACIPILIALAGKANIVTILTGISHEKLNIVHRWVAWISFALAWVHTIPFFWISYTDGGYENVKVQFFWGSTGRTEWGGVPPLVMLGLLCILSLPQIRDRFYEGFYQVHILLAITYFGLLYWHAGNVLDSWIYLYATLALWLSSWLARTFWFTQPLNIHHNWFEGAPAKLTAREGGMTEIEILMVNQGFKWRPMQHCFLRVFDVAPLGNHPFTICGAYIPPASSTTVGRKIAQEEEQTLTFLARTHAGFTKNLANYTKNNPDNQLSIWVEGPYGGLSRKIELAYDKLILIAGGGGITACLPWLSFLAQKVRDGKRLKDTVRLTAVHLFWSVKDKGHFSWASGELKRYFEILKSSGGGIEGSLAFYVTQGGEIDENGIHKATGTKTFESEKKVASDDSNGKAIGDDKITSDPETPQDERVVAYGDNEIGSDLDVSTFGTLGLGRQCIAAHLPGLLSPGRNFVIGCGPASLRSDVANAVAQEQRSVLKGKTQEIALHLEEFGW